MTETDDGLDGVFLALSDPTRRAVVRRLGGGPAAVGVLAEPFAMTLPSFLKHIRVLEASGVIRTQKRGRIRTCVLHRERLAAVESWLDDQRRSWSDGIDRLEAFVTEPMGEAP